MHNDFIIHLEGLEIGEHSFNYLLDNSFFESLDYSLIDDGEVKVDLLFKKNERFFELTFSYVGSIKQVCDRCGDDFDFPIKQEINTLLKFGDEELEDDGIWVITRASADLDIRHYLYESLCLLLPSKITHLTEDECNQELLEKLNEYSAQAETKEVVDPRWDALNKLK